MKPVTKAEAYSCFDNFVDNWVEVAPYAHEELIQEKFLVLDAIDAAVEEAYQCGFNDARDQGRDDEN